MCTSKSGGKTNLPQSHVLAGWGGREARLTEYCGMHARALRNSDLGFFIEESPGTSQRILNRHCSCIISSAILTTVQALFGSQPLLPVQQLAQTAALAAADLYIEHPARSRHQCEQSRNRAMRDAVGACCTARNPPESAETVIA